MLPLYTYYINVTVDGLPLIKAAWSSRHKEVNPGMVIKVHQNFIKVQQHLVNRVYLIMRDSLIIETLDINSFTLENRKFKY
jgi:hypothetical protein